MAAAAFIALRNRAFNRRRRKEAQDEDGDSVPGLEMPATAPAGLRAQLPTVGPPKLYWRYQQQVYTFYTSNTVQLTVALIIVGNFVITIIEKEYDPYPENLQQNRALWQTCDSVFNILFAIELVINMAGSWFLFFWKNPWNVFDFIVVLVGLLAMGNALNGPLEDLKMLRAFRVFRLFKRVKSLNKIVTALFKAIPGVINAFLIMLIVMCIYAILAVEYFRDAGADGTFVTETKLDEFGVSLGRDAQGMEIIANQTVTSITARGLRYGEEYYGTFSRALYTLFQVLTGESWAEAVARPLLFGVNPRNAFGTAFFFTSFILITQIVLVNVVVAVLLDKFVTEDEPPAPPAHEPPATPAADASAVAVSTSSSRGASARAGKAKLQSQVSAVCEDVAKIKSQLGDVMALKGRLDQLLDAMGAPPAGTVMPAGREGAMDPDYQA
jgi:hypothetical protein